MGSEDPKKSSTPIFKSSEIHSTKSKEQVNHFVNVKSSRMTPIISSLKPSEKSKEEHAKIHLEKNQKRKDALEKIKKDKNKIMSIATVIILILIIGILLSSPIRKYFANKEADQLTQETEEYIAFYLENYYSSTVTTENPGTETGTEEEFDPEYAGKDFDALYNEITNWLKSDNSFRNDERSLDLANALMNLTRNSQSTTIYTNTIETIEKTLPKLENDKTKAEFYMILAEAYFYREQKAEAYNSYSKAIEFNPSINEPDYYKTKTATFIDMWLYCQEREME